MRPPSLDETPLPVPPGGYWTTGVAYPEAGLGRQTYAGGEQTNANHAAALPRAYWARATAGRETRWLSVGYADDGQPSSLSFLNQRVVRGARVLMSAADPQPDRKL